MTDRNASRPDDLSPTYNFSLPGDVEAGAYADFVNIWHNNETFILDFAAMTQPPRVVHDDSGDTAATIECRIVTRVRIPQAQVWEVMKGLEKQLAAWENERPRLDKPPTP